MKSKAIRFMFKGAGASILRAVARAGGCQLPTISPQLLCAQEIMKNEGISSMFKGAGANILRAVAGAGVLAGYDQLQVLVFGKKFGSGE